MPKRSICIFLFVIACSFSACTPEKNSPKPNIIYVLADDLGIGDVQAFNPDGKIPTPYLDKLAAGGMRFTDAHTSSSVCTPTRYSILTGRYNWRSTLKKGVTWGKSKALIPDDRSTVGDLLQAQGYHTAFIGKWHLGWDWQTNEEDEIDFTQKIQNGPNDRGFSYMYGHAASLDMPPYVYVEDGLATMIPTDTTGNKDYQGFWRRGATAADFQHERVTPHLFEKSFEYLEKRAAEKAPFFLYLALPSPHTPILPTEAWQGKSGLNPYGDFVMMVDHYMGLLEANLKRLSLDQNTLIVFTSDNGCSPRAKFDELEAQGHYPSYRYRGHKADLFEGGHRVPFIVKWPGVVSAGSVSDATICTTDFMATCAEIVGQALADTEGEDSFSMLPLLTQKESEYQRSATVHHSIDGHFAIRQDKWKLLIHPGSGGWSYPRKRDSIFSSLPPYQLYDLDADPYEQSNLLEQHPEKVQALAKLLIEYIEQGRSTPGNAQENEGEDNWPQLDWIADFKPSE